MATTAFTIDMRAPLDRLKSDLGGAQGAVVNAARAMQRGFGSFGSSIGGSIAGMLSFQAVLGTLVGGAGIGLLIKNAIQAGDEIGEMATRVGLSTTALQEYTHAMSQGGASSQQLETSLRILNQRLTEAATDGASQAGKLFNSLKVAATTGDNIRDLDSVLGDLADRFQAIASPAQRAALAQELFGRAGSRMLPTLVQGRAGLQALREEAHRMGVVLSADAIVASDRAADSMVRLSNVISANLTRTIVQLAPAIETMAQGLADLIGKIQPFLQLFVSNEAAGVDVLGQRFEEVTRKIKELEAASASASKGFSGWLNSLSKGFDVTTKIESRLQALRVEQEQLALALAGKGLKAPEPPQVGAAIPKGISQVQENALEEARRIIKSLDPAVTAAEKKVLDLANRFDQLAEKAGPAAGAVLRIKTEALELARAAGELEVWEKVHETFQKSLPTLDEAGKAAEEIRRQVNEAAREAPRYADAIIREGEALIAAKRAHADLKIEIERIGRAMDDAETEAQDMRRVVAALEEPFESLNETIEEHILQLEVLRTATDVFAGAGVAGLGTFNQGLERALEQQVEKLSQHRAELVRLQGPLDDQSDQFRRLASEIANVDARLKSAGASLRDVVATNRADQLAADFALIDANVELFGEHLEGLTQKIARNRQEVNELLAGTVTKDDARVVAIVQQNNLLERQARIVQAVGDIVSSSMTTAFDTVVDAFARGEAAAIEWGDVVQDILTDIIKTLFQILVVETAIKAIRGIAASAFGGAEIPATASGGVVFGPQVRLVGEAGPEAIVPLDKFFGRGGGGDVTVNIHPPEGTETKTENRRDAHGNRTIEVMITKVVKQALDGGVFDGAMGGNFGLSRQGARR